MKMYMAITSEPDGIGRVSFTLYWKDPDGVYRREKGKDGKVVGYRRAQCFKADPAEYVRRGAIVADSDAIAREMAWGTA